MYPNLKLELWKKRLRQNQLAYMLGMDDATLSKIINGFRPPSEQLRARIAALLEANEQWLFEPAPRTAQFDPPIPPSQGRTPG